MKNENIMEDHEKTPEKLHNMTFRAFVFGAVVVCLTILGWARSAARLAPTFPGSGIGAILSPVALIGPMLIHAFNALVRRFGKKEWAFSNVELIIVYTMTSGALLLMSLFFRMLGWTYGFMGLERRVPQAFDVVVDSVSVIAPLRDQRLFLGFMTGNATVPWSAWMPVLIGYFFTGLVALGMFICLIVLLRRRWTEIERLTYPVVEPTLSFLEDTSERSMLVMFKSGKWPFILGACIPAIVISLNSLHAFFPAIPSISTYIVHYRQFLYLTAPEPLRTSWFRTYFITDLDFSIVGFLFFVESQLLFSYWFFYALYMAKVLILGGSGRMIPEEIHRTTSMSTVGAFGLYGLILLWTTRHDIAALLRMGKEEVSDEPFGPRLALIGLGVGSIYFILYGTIVYGTPVLTLVFYMVLLFAGVVGLLKFRAEAGYPAGEWQEIWSIGGNLLRFWPQTAYKWLGFSYSHRWIDHRLPAVACHAVDCFEMAGRRKLRKKHVTLSLMLTYVMTFVIVAVLILNYTYKYGATNVSGMYADTHSVGPAQVVQRVLDGKAGMAEIRTYVMNFILGAVGVGFLTIMHRQFVWWPFHPIGYMSIWGVGSKYGLIALVTWLIKVLSYRWGGPKLQNSMKPFFLGLIFGNVVTTSFWFIVNLISAAV